MTQDELAQKLFVTRQTVSNYENGKSRPDVEMLDRIAQMLETDIVTLIYGPTAKKIPGVVFACGAAVNQRNVPYCSALSAYRIDDEY